jgi:hypothetical protein
MRLNGPTIYKKILLILLKLALGLDECQCVVYTFNYYVK